MKEISENDLKLVQLNILKNVDEFCRIHNINYSLACGTLIGAVRHKGYIPWDDDIDIMMLRADYELFISEYTSNQYKVYSSKKNKDYNYPFAKVSDENTVFIEESDMKQILGVNIDIFPIDNLPNNLCASIKLIKKIKFYRNLLQLKHITISRKRNLIRNLFLFVSKLVLFYLSQNYLVNKIESISTSYNSFETDYVGNIVEGYGISERNNKNVFTKFIELPFESIHFKVIADYDIYLKGIYGNYMKYPPEEFQISHHAFKAYYK